MKQRGFILVFAFIFFGLCFKNEPSPLASGQPDRTSFGVKIGLLPTGELTQYALVYFKDNKLLSIQGIPLNQLVKIGQGEWPLPRTTFFYNYFQENGLYDDTLEDGSILDYGAAFDSLWKIRFPEHPFDPKAGKGWSNGEFRPSLSQQKYIYDRYGCRCYDQDYFVDTSFFRLLKDVMDEDWIAQYKSLRD